MEAPGNSRFGFGVHPFRVFGKQDTPILSTPEQNYGDVAQIFNLLYRRFAIGCATENPWPGAFGRMTECNSAIQQIKNLRYDTSSYLCPLALSERLRNSPMGDVGRMRLRFGLRQSSAALAGLGEARNKSARGLAQSKSFAPQCIALINKDSARKGLTRPTFFANNWGKTP